MLLKLLSMTPSRLLALWHQVLCVLSAWIRPQGHTLHLAQSRLLLNFAEGMNEWLSMAIKYLEVKGPLERLIIITIYPVNLLWWVSDIKSRGHALWASLWWSCQISCVTGWGPENRENLQGQALRDTTRFGTGVTLKVASDICGVQCIISFLYEEGRVGVITLTLRLRKLRS